LESASSRKVTEGSNPSLTALKMKENKPLDEIFTRTCCRDFDPKREISREQIELILKAGQAAPSAKNRQPYFFIAIINKNCREEIYKAAEQGRKKQFSHLSAEDFKKVSSGSVGSNDKSIFDASAAILVLRKLDFSYSEAKNQSENLNIKEEQGVATAAYSMLIQAEKLGISSGWVCSPLYIKDELQQILPKYGVEWQNEWLPRLIIPLGYCLSKPEKPKRLPLKEKSIFI
jgi:nitroreductase